MGVDMQGAGQPTGREMLIDEYQRLSSRNLSLIPPVTSCYKIRLLTLHSSSHYALEGRSTHVGVRHKRQSKG